MGILENRKPGFPMSKFIQACCLNNNISRFISNFNNFFSRLTNFVLQDNKIKHSFTPLLRIQLSNLYGNHS